MQYDSMFAQRLKPILLSRIEFLKPEEIEAINNALTSDKKGFGRKFTWWCNQEISTTHVNSEYGVSSKKAQDIVECVVASVDWKRADARRWNHLFNTEPSHFICCLQRLADEVLHPTYESRRFVGGQSIDLHSGEYDGYHFFANKHELECFVSNNGIKLPLRETEIYGYLPNQDDARVRTLSMSQVGSRSFLELDETEVPHRVWCDRVRDAGDHMLGMRWLCACLDPVVGKETFLFLTGGQLTYQKKDIALFFEAVIAISHPAHVLCTPYVYIEDSRVKMWPRPNRLHRYPNHLSALAFPE